MISEYKLITEWLMIRNTTYYAFLVALWQLSCGDLRHQRVAEALPAVIIATQKQVDTLQVVANRYIVVFKTQPGLEQATFVGYRAETSYFSSFLNAKYHYDAGIKDIRMISAIELPSLAEESTTPLTTLNWQTPPRTAAGIITEVHFASNELAAAHLQQWQERGDIHFAEPVYISSLTSNHEGGNTPPAEEPLTGYAAMAEEYSKYQQENSDSYWWHKEIKLADAMQEIAAAAPPRSNIYRKWSDAATSSNRPIIAVFDSGIDYEHPALRERMFRRGDSSTNWDLGCGNDVHGCNTTNPKKGMLGDGQARPWGTNESWAKRLKNKVGGACPSSDPAPGTKKIPFSSCSHGTHVAGIIVADGSIPGKRCDAAGVCPLCRILNIRVLSGVGVDGPEHSRFGGVTDTSILNGLKYVYELWANNIDVRIINASIGKFHRSRAVALLISKLKKQSSKTAGGRGVLVIGAAGNEDTMARTYPAALKDVLAVAATGANGIKSQFSNFGMWVDIAAPGGSTNNSICSTVPGAKYKGQAGTSMSTPVVAGVAGLMIAVTNDELDANEVEDALLFNSDPCKLYPGKDNPIETCQDEESQAAANTKYYLTKLDNTKNPVPLLGYGLLNALNTIKRDRNSAAYFVNIDQYEQRIDLTSCATLATSSASPLLLLLLPLPLLLLLRRRCRSRFT